MFNPYFCIIVYSGIEFYSPTIWKCYFIVFKHLLFLMWNMIFIQLCLFIDNLSFLFFVSPTFLSLTSYSFRILCLVIEIWYVWFQLENSYFSSNRKPFSSICLRIVSPLNSLLESELDECWIIPCNSFLRGDFLISVLHFTSVFFSCVMLNPCEVFISQWVGTHDF